MKKRKKKIPKKSQTPSLRSSLLFPILAIVGGLCVKISMRKQKEHDHLREPVCAKCACVCVKPRARRDDANINHDLDAPQMTRLETVHSDTH